MTEENYRALFDRASPSRDLVEDTLAAAERPRRKSIPARRLAAALVCLALVLGVGNYQALAAGVQKIIRFFAGTGASETPVMVVEEADRWTEGDWLCQLDGVSQGEWLLLELYLVSPELEEHQLATRKLQVYAGDTPWNRGVWSTPSGCPTTALLPRARRGCPSLAWTVGRRWPGGRMVTSPGSTWPSSIGCRRKRPGR